MIEIEQNGTGEIFYATTHSAGFDICAQEEVEIQPGEYKLLGTGLRIKSYQIAEKAEINGMFFRILPEIQIRPRSGLAAKHGITVLNTPATVDCDYAGEIKVNLINLSREPFKVHAGDRIAQGVCAFVLQIPSVKVKDVQRGEGGHGSTGR
jgi:dUTP pyrophosphatase